MTNESKIDPYMFDIDISSGNGASSEWDGTIDNEAPIENDGRSITRTGFKSTSPADVNGNPVNNPTIERFGKEYSKWDYLNQLNDGKFSDEHKTRGNLADLKRDAKTWCDTLEAPQYIIDRVTYLIEKVDSFERGNTKAEATVLALITLVCNEEDWWVQRRKPLNPPKGIRFGPDVEVDGIRMSLLRKFARECSVDMKNINSIRNDLRDELL